MKHFDTVGEGPDNEWRSAEARARGERKLLEDFAHELRRALEGKRVRTPYITRLLASDARLLASLKRLYWEQMITRLSDNWVASVLKRIEGHEYKFNRRWSNEEQKMLWGFERE